VIVLPCLVRCTVSEKFLKSVRSAGRAVSCSIMQIMEDVASLRGQKLHSFSLFAARESEPVQKHSRPVVKSDLFRQSRWAYASPPALSWFSPASADCLSKFGKQAWPTPIALQAGVRLPIVVDSRY